MSVLSGLGHGLLSGSSQNQLGAASTCTTNTLTTAASSGTSTTSQLVGGISSSPNTVWIDSGNMGTSAIRPGQPIHIAPSPPVGDMLTLTKTANGEFVLTGSGDTLALLMDYFMQSPEMWLRLAAMKSEIEENG